MEDTVSALFAESVQILHLFRLDESLIKGFDNSLYFFAPRRRESTLSKNGCPTIPPWRDGHDE